MKPTIHIIGAGLAGLSAAVRCAPHARVILYEASGQAGGRCRSYHDVQLGRVIDNGNHLILGANRETWDYLRTIGAADSLQPIGYRYPFLDLPSSKCWETALPFGLPYRHLRARFLTPFCISALNTPTAQASSALLGALAWQLLIRGRQGATGWLPKDNLQASLIDPALAHIRHHGGELHTRRRITTLDFGDDAVIIATPAPITAELLPGLSVPDRFEPIINGHFLCEHGQPPGTVLGLTGGTADWLFFKNGMVSTTTSAASRLADFDHSKLAHGLWTDICMALFSVHTPLPSSPHKWGEETVPSPVHGGGLGWGKKPPPHRILIEKRATFAATSTQQARRPRTITNQPNTWLAGDYTATGLPATIEGSIRSGTRAASLALKYLGKKAT